MKTLNKINTQMKKYCLFMLIGFVAFSCKKEEVSEFTDSPIIESYLSPGDVFNVKVSRQIPFVSDVAYSSDDINALNISVNIGGNNYSLTPMGNGVYVDSSIIVAENDNYHITFQFNSKEVTAYTYVPSKPQNITQSATQMELARIDSTTGPGSGGDPFSSQPDPIVVTWNNTDNSYYLVLVENVESTLDPIRDFGDSEPPGNIFRKSPTNSSSEEIRSQEFQYFGTHRIIIYHVLPDYASLYDQNSTSSQNLSNPSTSITNGYGIFTGLNSDTLWVEITEQ